MPSPRLFKPSRCYHQGCAVEFRALELRCQDNAADEQRCAGAVLATLVEIDAGRWPDSANAPGTKGGITFRNSEGRLPAVGAGGGRVVYQEWDVNAKKNGQGRDAERIVTGNDGSAWYTLDHYDTFVRIR